MTNQDDTEPIGTKLAQEFFFKNMVQVDLDYSDIRHIATAGLEPWADINSLSFFGIHHRQPLEFTIHVRGI
jgi:hypothetical protein